MPPANPSSRKQLLPVSSNPQRIYRSGHKAPCFPPLCLRAGTPPGRSSTQLCQRMEQAAMPLLSTPSPGSPAETLPAHGSRAHLCHPQTGGSWGPSNWAKGRSQKLAAHRGYFGQGSSHSPGQEAEKFAREQRPQEQPPALPCSPLEQIQELTCPPKSNWMPCLRARYLPGRQRMDLASLQEELEGQCQLLPRNRVQPEGSPAPSAWKASLSPGVGGEHPDSILS